MNKLISSVCLLFVVLSLSSCGSKCHHHSGGSAFDAAGFGHAYRDSVRAVFMAAGEAYEESSDEALDAPVRENQINRGEIDSQET